MRLVIMVFFFLLGSALGALADPYKILQPEGHVTGRDLKSFCVGKTDVDYGYCAGYMTAVADIMVDHKLYKVGACNHQKVKSQQLVEIFRMFIGEDNQRLKYPAALAVAHALSASFPCR